jgi:hypothetical protein
MSQLPPGPPTQPFPQPQPQPWPPQGMPPHGGQPPSGYVPVQQQPKKPKRLGWAPLALVIGLAVGGIFGSIGDGTATTAEPTATVTVTETAEAETGPTKTVKPKPKPEPQIDSTMDEGTYEIGVDAKPGRYKTRVPENSPGCYWERLKDDRGGFNSIIANDNVNPGGRVSITVRRGEFFNSSDCGTWKRV